MNRKIICHYCRRQNHLAKNCRFRIINQICQLCGNSGHAAPECNRTQYTSENCQLCNEPDHTAPNCYKQIGRATKSRYSQNSQRRNWPGHTARTCYNRPENWNCHDQLDTRESRKIELMEALLYRRQKENETVREYLKVMKNMQRRVIELMTEEDKSKSLYAIYREVKTYIVHGIKNEIAQYIVNCKDDEDFINQALLIEESIAQQSTEFICVPPLSTISDKNNKNDQHVDFKEKQRDHSDNVKKEDEVNSFRIRDFNNEKCETADLEIFENHFGKPISENIMIEDETQHGDKLFIRPIEIDSENNIPLKIELIKETGINNYDSHGNLNKQVTKSYEWNEKEENHSDKCTASLEENNKTNSSQYKGFVLQEESVTSNTEIVQNSQDDPTTESLVVMKHGSSCITNISVERRPIIKNNNDCPLSFDNITLPKPIIIIKSEPNNELNKSKSFTNSINNLASKYYDNKTFFNLKYVQNNKNSELNNRLLPNFKNTLKTNAMNSKPLIISKTNKNQKKEKFKNKSIKIENKRIYNIANTIKDVLQNIFKHASNLGLNSILNIMPP